MKNNKNIHSGHRERMREKLMKAGPAAFCDHELLEVLLFASISRRNTNDIAHALLDRFGSLHGVLTATPDALSAVEGVGSSTVALLQTVNEIMKRSDRENLSTLKEYKTFEQIGEHLVSLYKRSSVEEVYVMTFDSSMRLLDCSLVEEGTVNSLAVDTRKIVKKAMDENATGVVISHNHPGGKLIASSEDAIMTRNIATALNLMGIELIDHILVAENRYTSILRAGYGL